MTFLSVIVPIGPMEEAWRSLLVDLKKLPHNTEIIFVSSQILHPTFDLPLTTCHKFHFIRGKPGRANLMNLGAAEASGNFLWFVHADSKFSHNSIKCLIGSLNENSEALHYFDLVFVKDASCLMKLNSLGVLFRSRLLKTPFGDQGLCISKKNFQKLGGYPEGEPYGEDHIFVCKARQQAIKLQPVGAKIYTSARKYQKNGWLKTTLLHQYLWIKQSLYQRFLSNTRNKKNRPL